MEESEEIYISGKITGCVKEEAMTQFNDAELFVNENMNYFPVNPFKIAPQDKDLEWIDFMRIDIKALVDCQAILMLSNWEESEGAKLELAIAKGLKMKIYYF